MNPLKEKMTTEGEKIAKIAMQLEPAAGDHDGVLSIEGEYLQGKLLNGSLRAIVRGEDASIVRYWKKQDPKAARFTLGRLGPTLERFKYDGPLGVDILIEDRQRDPLFVRFRTGPEPLPSPVEDYDWHVFLRLVLDTGKLATKERVVVGDPVKTVFVQTAQANNIEKLDAHLLTALKFVPFMQYDMVELERLTTIAHKLITWKYL